MLARAGALGVLALVALDAAAVPAALPSVRVELGSSTSGLVWMQDAYLVALAVTLVLAGRFASGLDRRLLAAAGLAAFAAGALVAAEAGATSTVVLGRLLQGAGTAVLLVPALDTLCGTRRRALLAIGAAALGLLALAPLIGGAVAEKADWRWLLRLELAPAALAGLVLAARPSGPGVLARAAHPRAAALAGGIVCAAAGLVQSRPWGWASLDTLLLLAAGAALLLYARREPIRPAGGAVLALAGAVATAVLFAPQYFELVRGLSPLRSGLLTVAVTGGAAGAAAIAALLARRTGAGPRLAAAGLALGALGALALVRVDPASSYALVVLALGVLGAGAGAAAGALAGSRPAGELVTSAAAGAALVVAAAGALFQRAQLEDRDGGGSFESALAAGLASSGWLLAALLAAAALLAWRRG